MYWLIPVLRRYGFVTLLLSTTALLRVASAQDPGITTQPQSLTNKAGTYPSFSVIASGTDPLGYQWYKDGQALGAGTWTGEQTNVLTIQYARKLHEGAYFVVVTNMLGSVTSVVATLTVLDTAIGAQPSNPNIPPRALASLSVGALGTSPFRYQWRLAGNPIAGATNSFLSVYGAATNAGVYDAVVSNTYGSVTSMPGVVTVNLSAVDGWVADANALVHASAVQADGRVVVGGSFTALGGYTRNRIGRVYADGSVDTQFNPNANGEVYCLLPLPDGKLLVGGAFTSLGGGACKYLGRLYPDGTLDTNFTATLTGAIYCLAWQDDGQILAGGVNKLMRFDVNGVVDPTFNPAVVGTIYSIVPQAITPVAGTGIVVGGSFGSIAGAPRQNLARLKYDGQPDNYFNNPVSGTVYAMASSGGSVVIGGLFYKVGQTSRANLARLDLSGSLVDSFNPGASNVVYSLTLQTDGKILVGGGFTTLAGVPRSYVGRLYPDGSIDPLFNPGANQTVYSLALQADGRLVAGGLFTSFGSATRKYLARLDATNDVAQSLTISGGQLTWLRDDALPFVDDVMFDYYLQGAGWVSLGTGERITNGWRAAGPTVPPDATLRAWGKAAGGRGGGSASIIQYATGPVVIVTQPVGQTVAAATILSVEAVGSGPFTYQWFRNGVPITGATDAASPYVSSGSYQVTVCNPFGCVQSDLAAIWRLNTVESAARPNPDNSVHALALQSDGKVLLGGSFSVASLNPRPFLARLNADGSLDTNFNANVGGTVLCLAVQPDGRILLGGTFTTAGGVPKYCLARLNADGSLDTGFSANATGGLLGTAVYCLSLQSAGKILVGGSFGFVSGEARDCLARLEADGSVDPTFVPGPNFHPNRAVNSILPAPGGLLLLGGCFATIPNVYHTYMWVQDNGSYAGFGYPGSALPSSAVCAMLAQPDGKVLLGGYDVRVDAVPGRMLARLNVDHSQDTAFPATADGPVFCFAAQADGKILVGGAFASLNGVSRSGLGRLNADGSLDTSFNPAVTGPSTAVYAVAPQTDGKVCLGGTFTNVAGSTRYNFARLPATAFVSENWAYDGATLTWLRQGPAAEFDSVSLESSPDGSTWQLLADGTPAGDAWQFTGVTLPFAQPARARGHVVASGIDTWQNLAYLKTPDIAIQPVSRTNALGSISGFYVAAQGQGPFAYQWFRNGVALQDGGPIAGAQSALLTFQVNDLSGGEYYATVSNLFGATNSASATLTTYDLATPPVILANEPSLGIYTNRFTFRFQGLRGQTCVVEFSGDLKFWNSISTNVLSTFNPVLFTDPVPPTAPQSFYRIRLQR